MPKRVLPDVSVLAKMYDAGMSPREIGAIYGVQRAAVEKMFRVHGVPMRSGAEAIRLTFARGRKVTSYWKGKKQPAAMVAKRAAKMTGTGNGRWRDGSQRRGYRGLIEKRECAACGTTARLGIHHKNNNHFDNRMANLMVLCNPCHLSLHARARWTARREGKPEPKSNAPIGWRG